MRILERSVYVGPSLYAHFPVIRLTLDLGELEAWPTVRLGADFIDGPPAALPGLDEHGCSYGEPGGFIRRMTEDEGTWLGHVLEHVAIELQNAAGIPVTFGKTRGTGADRRLPRGLRVRAARRGDRGGELALRLLASLLPAGTAPRRHHVRRVGPRRRARRLHPLCAAPGPGPEHRLHGPRRRSPGDPLDAAQQLLPGPARPRPLPAAHPGHRHGPDPPHRGGTGRRQGRDEPHPLAAGAPGTPAGAGAEPKRGRLGRLGASGTRWWSSRTTGTTGGRWPSTSLPRRRCAAAFERPGRYRSR
jgi:hypothetical protein